MLEKFVEKFVAEHVAVSSLESPEHATRKDPRILKVTWFIGKRCNYDCSYCSPYLHDNYSPHISKDKAIHFIDQLEQYAIEQNKEFKIIITGGEPFVNPSFLDILQYIRTKKNLTQLSVVSNGSLPLQTYVKSSDYLSTITISLHLEQSQDTIDSTVEKIIELNKITAWFLNVNVMLLPGKLDTVKAIIEKLKKNNVKFVVRKIEPPFDTKGEKVEKGDLEKIKLAEKTYNDDKEKYFSGRGENLEQSHSLYYSKEELDFFESYYYYNIKEWKNIKLHSPKKYIEVNTDNLKAKNLNAWQGWQCYIGIDSLYVEYNGLLFRGNCMQGGPIGKVGEKINWPSAPIICPVKRCWCNADMVVRKVKETKFKSIIDE